MSTGGDRQTACELLFPTVVYQADVPGADALNARLLPLIRAWRAQDPEGEPRTNELALGGWHSRTDMHMRGEFAPLRDEIYAFMEGVFTSLGYAPDMGPGCGSMWANVNPPGASNRHHTHPQALWSGVYYVHTPAGSGDLYFTDPRPQTLVAPPRLEAGQRAPLTSDEVRRAPVAGRVLAFPAWLPHGVMPNLSRETGPAAERISVSFNYHQLQRPGVSPGTPRAGPY